MHWYQKYLSVYEKNYEEIPQEAIDIVRENIRKIQSDEPLVTVSVIAYNEEKHLLACLWSLSENICKYDFEIIVVNNNSNDLTEKLLEKLQVTWYTELQQGAGHARNCGLTNAKGQYHLCIDADTIYPPYYIEYMINYLKKDKIACVYSLWSFIPSKGYPRWQLSIYEHLRNIYLIFQNIQRPELCVRGMSFGFKTEIGKKIKFRTDIIRGEDGSMALSMKSYGKLKLITNRKCIVYTGLGTLKNDGSLFNSLIVRIIKAFKNIGSLFTRKEHYEDKEDNIIKQ